MKKRAYFVTAILVAVVLVLSSCPLPQGLGPQVAVGHGVEVSAASVYSRGARALIDDTGVTSVHVTATTQGGQMVGSGELTKDVAQRVWRGMLEVTETGSIDFTAVAKDADGSPLYTGTGSTTVTGSGDSVTIMMSVMQGLVGEWLFDGNANDTSGNNINGTLNGDTVPTTDRFGNAGKAYSFDSDGDYIQAAADLLPTADRTVSLWFYANDVVSRPSLMGYGGGSGGTSWIEGLNWRGDGHFEMQGHSNVNPIQYTYSVEPVNRWVNFVVETDSSGTRMYVDGAEVASNSTYVNNTNVVTKDLIFGVIVAPGGNGPYTDGNGNWLNGCLDDIRIYNRALSVDEVSALYHEGGWPTTMPVSRSGLVGEWLFTANANDTSGGEHDGTVVNGAPLAADRFGASNQAYQFNGSNQLIDCGNPSDNSLDIGTNATISLWCKYPGTPAEWSTFLGKDVGQYTNNKWIFCYSVGALHWHFNGSAADDLFSSAWLPTANLWYHVVVVKSGMDYSFFINAAAWGSDATTADVPYPIAADLTIGNAEALYFSGTLDDVRIYNRAITADEVRALYIDGVN